MDVERRNEPMRTQSIGWYRPPYGEYPAITVDSPCIYDVITEEVYGAYERISPHVASQYEQNATARLAGDSAVGQMSRTTEAE